MSDPCLCAECVRAGCDRPPVTLAASGRYPQRELHGRELVRWYAGDDERRAGLRRVVEQFKAKGIRAQRGDEPR